MKILVLGGGISPERQVSLRSAKAVAEAARAAGFEVETADPADGLDALDNLADTIVFPILHGKNGEDGVIQKELEARGLPFLGSDSAASIACFDKWTTRMELLAAGIPMPNGALVDEKSYGASPLCKRHHALKIVHGGSSIGTLIVRKDEAQDEQSVSEIFAMEDKAVVEELIEGREVTVPVLDGKALPVIEIVPPQNEEFDYDNKYNGRTRELVPAESVSEELQKNARELAEKVYETMGARHLARVDMMIDKHDSLYVLEINTMPGMTEASLYPKSAAVAGLAMPQLVRKFLELVKRDYNLT
ncbi:MAG TPA: D-alanine--D-alanine ligase [Candidatus Saccharimonadales bacterium]|nr:D-alanine--D-alanine ligase [Candidatus Saccharimonadales bacterium]